MGKDLDDELREYDWWEDGEAESAKPEKQKQENQPMKESQTLPQPGKCQPGQVAFS